MLYYVWLSSFLIREYSGNKKLSLIFKESFFIEILEKKAIKKLFNLRKKKVRLFLVAAF